MDIKGMGAFILIIFFTIFNLVILHKFVFKIYFSGYAIFKEIFYSFLLAFLEAGIVVKVFGGVSGVILAIIKFILKLALILAVIAAIGFALSKIIPIAKNKGAEEDTPKENDDLENDLNEHNTDGNTIVTCSKCGSQLQDGAIFCQKCGEKVL